MVLWLAGLMTAVMAVGFGLGMTTAAFFAEDCLDEVCRLLPTDLGSIGMTLTMVGFILTIILSGGVAWKSRRGPAQEA